LDTLYRRRLSGANARLLARIQVVFARLFDPGDPNTSLAAVGAVVAGWVAAGQAGFGQETANYLRALVAQAMGVRPDLVDPFPVPDGLVGVMDSGAPLTSLSESAPATYWARIGAGLGEAVAAQAAQAWLNSVAGSEPFRVANATTTGNAEADPRFTGRVIRLTRPGACEFCRTIADRGYIPAHAGFAAHRNCHCTPSPEISKHVTSRQAVARGRRALEQQP
jgi:hypothetical protein